jgi:hypothetical protein
MVRAALRPAFAMSGRHVAALPGMLGTGNTPPRMRRGTHMGLVMLSQSPDHARIDPLVLITVLIGIVSAVVLATAL